MSIRRNANLLISRSKKGTYREQLITQIINIVASHTNVFSFYSRIIKSLRTVSIIIEQIVTFLSKINYIRLNLVILQVKKKKKKIQINKNVPT